MSWTNKVANIIKGQIASHIGNKIMSSFCLVVAVQKNWLSY